MILPTSATGPENGVRTLARVDTKGVGQEWWQAQGGLPWCTVHAAQAEGLVRFQKGQGEIVEGCRE